MKRQVVFSAVVIAAVAIGAGQALPAESVTMTTTSAVVPSTQSTTQLAGVISSGEAGEPVITEQKTCRQRRLKAGSTVRTTDGGAWSTAGYVSGRTVFRARWRDAHSREVVVLVRPTIVLGQISRRVFRAILQMGVHANGERLALQRFDADQRAWKTVKTFVFESSSTGYPQMTISANVPKGVQLRLALTRAQAQPCFLAGYSNLVGT